MIETSTVLVLGAGASSHCQYPLGGQLVAQLSALRGTRELDDLPEAWSRDSAEDFLTRLSRSGHYSIDAFLEANREHAGLGKYLIARELKKHELIDRLYPPHDSGWYQYLLNALLGQQGAEGVAASRLGIITFNYDRSLEAYLFNALQARLRIDAAEAAVILATIPIVHVHGVLGAFPQVEYRPQCEMDELVGISSQIQIIHEIADQTEGFCNPMFEKAHQMLHAAARIYLLGFGFHADNVRRFRFFTPETVEGKTIRGTVTGLGPRELASLHERLAPAGFTPSMLPPDGTSCNNFFSHAGALD